MTYDEKKAILESYRELDREVKCYRDTINQFEQSALQAGIQKIDDMPHGSGSTKDLSDYVVKLESMNLELRAKMQMAMDRKKEILKWIESLADSRGKVVLIYKYINLHSLGWIADELDNGRYSDKTIKRIHRKSIENLPDLIKKDGACP